MRSNRVRLLLVTATAGLLAVLGANSASAVDDSDGQLLPNVDVRADETVSLVAPRASERLAKSLGDEGFVQADSQTGAVAFVGRTDGFLTRATDADAADIVVEYVQANRQAFGLSEADISNLDLSRSYTSIDGVTHVTFAQKFDGIESFDSYLRGNVTKNGRLINVSGAPVSDLSVVTTSPTLSADEALLVARDNVGGDSTVPPVKKVSQGPAQKTTYKRYAESASLTVFAQAGKDRLAWQVQVLDADSILYRVVVDAASGDVLARQSLTAFDNNDAQVWPLHPSDIQPPIAVNFGTDPTWLDRSNLDGIIQLRGNNTHTYSDSGTNGYQPGEGIPRNGGQGGNWTYPMTWYAQSECPTFGCTWDSTVPASKTINSKAGAVGLFYLTNHFHDYLLKAPIGFDEASGNFEQVNSSGQGVGNDAVLAEAQDAGGTNNANFSTPADGGPGRMQMYMWNGSGPTANGPQYDVDGSASADVVYHEYTHGVTNRLVGNGGGLSALQSRSMGEGWSDFYALDLLVHEGDRTDSAGPGDLWLGEYVTGIPGIFGGISRIRHQAIDCPVGAPAVKCPDSGTAGPGGYTFGDLGKVGTSPTSVHDNGEIWQQTMWDLRSALGRNEALKIVTGGLRLSPAAPSMLDMRDAILQSAAVNNVDVTTVWSVFATRGMGEDASTPSAGSTTAVEDFTSPPASVTEAATQVTVDSSILNGRHKSGGKPTDYRFEYGTTAGYGQVTPVTAGGSAPDMVPVAAAVAGLAPNTEYHFRLVGLRGGVVVSQGVDRSFTTAAALPQPAPEVLPARDTTAPTVKIKKAPKKKITTKKAKAKVKVTFTSEPGAAFTCKIDKKKYKSCKSPAKFKAKSKPGKGNKHKFYVVATDPAGNASKPAKVKFRVVRKS